MDINDFIDKRAATSTSPAELSALRRAKRSLAENYAMRVKLKGKDHVDAEERRIAALTEDESRP